MPDDVKPHTLVPDLTSETHWADLAPAAGQVGRWVMPLDGGDAVGDATLARLTGLDGMDGRFPPTLFLDRIAPEDRADVEEAIRRAVEDGETYEAVFRFERADGRTIWLEGAGRVADLGEGRALLGVNYDVTELREAQARAELVAGEMAHRIKNLFALVQSIHTMAARSADSVDALHDAFAGRLRALAGLNTMTLGDRKMAVALSDLVTAAGGDHVAAGRLRPDLPDPCDLSGSAAQTMVLLLNELMTNAVKHGALRGDDGSIELRVTRDHDSFAFEWAEETGAPVSAPTRDGFGMRVLTGMTAATHSGRPEVEWGERGLRFRCTWPTEGFLAR